MHGCMWLDYCRRAMRLTTEGCPLVSLQHVLLPGPPPGYIEGQIASMATRTGQQNEVAACLNQAAMRRWPSTRVCGTLAGNAAVYAQPGAYRGCPPRNPWAKRPSGRPGHAGRSSAQGRPIASLIHLLHPRRIFDTQPSAFWHRTHLGNIWSRAHNRGDALGEAPSQRPHRICQALKSTSATALICIFHVDLHANCS